MPIYEYRCNKCSHQFDIRRGFNEDSSVACPDCCSESSRIFSPVPIIFKGSGFYITDNRKDSFSESASETAESSTSSISESLGD